MIHIKQYILTLVALLALTTQAWAEVDLSNKIWQPGDQFNIGEAWFYYDDTNKNKFYHTNGVESQVPSFQYDGHYKQWYFDSFVNVNKQIDNDTESQLSTTTRPIWLSVPDGKTSTDQPVGFKIVGGDGSKEHPYKFGLVYELPSGTPFPITWSATTPNTASIDAMPAGNVEVNVEYYPQAALTTVPSAKSGVKATTDDDIISAGTVAAIGSTETKQGTLMYHVSDTQLTEAQLEALTDADWSADVPKATGITEAGTYYVYYYVKGNVGQTDETIFSDGDFSPISVTIREAPTYDVYFAQGTNLNEWSADPNSGILKGETVTITYTGTRKVIGVKAKVAVVGKFTINSTGAKVNFAPGNLQATTTDKGESWTWAFAANQWDYIGSATAIINGNGTVEENGTVDLFGWVGASSTWTGAAQYGISNSTSVNSTDGYGNNDSEALKSDWGMLIGDGNTWRTLTSTEWHYIFSTRTTGGTVGTFDQARYTEATINTDVINGVNGVILFPDGVDFASTEFTTLGTINDKSAWSTKCTSAQWTALADKGCVFLPAAGFRDGALAKEAGSYGRYRSSSPYTSVVGSASSLSFGYNSLISQLQSYRSYGYSVRLVKAAE